MGAERLVGPLLLAALAAWPAAAERQLVASVTGGEASPTVGDRVTVTLSAAGSGDDDLWGEPEMAASSEWAVVQKPQAIPNSEPPSWRVVLAPLSTGALELPGATVGVRDGDGELVRVAVGEPPTLEVGSVLAGEEDVEPATLKEPVGVEGWPWERFVPWAAALSPLLLAALAVWAWRRGRRVLAAVGPADPDPDVELERLVSHLRRRLDELPAAELCDRLAHGLRRYLTRRSGRPAADMTSTELRALARDVEWPPEVQQGIPRVMGLADRVRFARAEARGDELAAGLDAALATARGLERHLQPTPDDGGEA